MKKLATILFALIIALTYRGDRALGQGTGTILQLDQWKATTTPYSAIAPNVHAKNIYAPYSFATTSALFTTSTTATSTFANGINLKNGCFSINNVCLSITGGSTASTTLLADNNTFSGLQNFGNTGTTTFSGGISAVGIASSNGLTLTGGSIFSTSAATSSLANGFNLSAGCFSINGICVTGSGTGASTTLLADNNTFSGLNTYTNAGTTTFTGGVSSAGLASSNGITLTGGSILSTSAASSTLANGLNLTAGCFSVNGVCVSGGGGGISGSGSSGQVTYWNGASSITGTSLFTFDGSKLGIGTTTPWGRLSVAGFIADTGPSLLVSSSTASGTTTSFAVTGGRVGVGTEYPGNSLSVVGSFGIFGTGTSTNTLASASASPFMVTGKSNGTDFATFRNSMPNMAKLVINTNTNRDRVAISATGGFSIQQTAKDPRWVERPAYDLAVGSRAHPEMGDLDGDGDLDIVSGLNSSITGARNIGDVTNPRMVLDTGLIAGVSAISGVTHPAMGDIDNDGDLDLFVGRETGDVVDYYENIGTVYRPHFRLYGAIFARNNPAPALADLDNDGDLDMMVGDVAGGVSDDIYGYINTGNVASSTWATNSAWDILNIGGRVNPALADMDNDGDYDLFTTSDAGAITKELVAYENTGTASSLVWTRNQNWENDNTHSSYQTIGMADMDNDGDYDHWIGDSVGVINYYENTNDQYDAISVLTQSVGIASSTPFGRLAVSYASTTLQPGFIVQHVASTSAPTFVIGSANNNGRIGIGTFNPGSTVSLFGNIGVVGSGIFLETRHKLLQVFTLATDYLTRRFSFRALFNQGATLTGLTSANQATGVVAALGKFEQRYGQRVHTWSTNQSTLAPTGVGGRPTQNYTVGDLDADGDLDLIFGLDDGQLRLSLNLGTTVSPIFVITNVNNIESVDVGSNAKPALADIDNDGDLDLFVGDNTLDVVYHYTNIGNATNPVFSLYGAVIARNNPAPAFADLDNDGDYDLLVGDIAGGVSDDIYGYINTGNVASSTWATNSSWDVLNIGGRSKPNLVDIDNDGDYDFFTACDAGSCAGGVSANSRLLAYENTGGAGNAAWTRKNAYDINVSGLSSGYSSAFGDFDADGDMDVIGNFAEAGGGSSFYLENTAKHRVNAFSGGFMGVGTTTPYAALSIWAATSTASDQLFDLATSASTSILRIRNDGQIFVNIRADQAHGTTTLSAGTATVNNNQVRTDSLFFLTRCILGGTPGHLSIGTRTIGTSFVINSSDVTDTSTICWEIKQPIY